MNRRRFLMISAAAMALPARAEPVRWHGRAMGAEATLTLHAPAPLAQAAIRAVEDEIAQAEALFSLYRDSALVQLNTAGVLRTPAPAFVDLLRQADQAHRLTNGAFDPTVQPLWQALSAGQETRAARALIGWNRVQVTPARIQLSPDQALTLNGIAQGWATDRVTARLRALGLRRVLVNLGEFAAVGGPWHLGVADPAHGLVAQRALMDRAIATSSAQATTVGGHSHILGRHSPKWSTVSVEAANATLADALSTGFMLMDEHAIRATLARLDSPAQVTLVESGGAVRQL